MVKCFLRSRIVTASVALTALLVGVTPATARAQSATLDRFRAGETPEDDFSTSRPTFYGHLRWGAQLALNYALNPLVWERQRGDAETETYRIVQHQLDASIGLSLGLFDWVVVYAGLPFTLVMAGEDEDVLAARGIPPADGAGLSDVSLGARVRLYGLPDDVFAIALQATVSFPTAGEQSYRGDAFLSVHPELLMEVRPGLRSRITLDLGAYFRRGADLTESNFYMDDELTFGLGFAIPVWTQDGEEGTHLDLHAAGFGALTFQDFGGRETSDFELIGGARFHHRSGFSLGLAGGAGLTRGVGSPDFRLILTTAWARPPRQEPPPPGDTDGDGLADPDDRCPSEPEDVDEFEDDDGCPDVDNDGDGLIDGVDRCPTVAGPPENRGCPDEDRDGDSVVDRLDNCPDEAGSVENHGCVEVQRVRLADQRIEVLERIFFETDRAVILERSFPLLDNVARVLNAHPEISLVYVEGHTDSRGHRNLNLWLSQQRAEAVVRYLVEHGHVDASRLEAHGFGPDRPLVENATTPEEHAQNRRVEFNIPNLPATIRQGDNAAQEDTIDR